MKVVIQKDLFVRSKEVFTNAQNKYGIKFCITEVLDESSMLKMQSVGYNCFVIGAEVYSDLFYKSLHADSLVIRYGVGYNAVPIQICKERNIKVAYTPGTLTDSVAEHSIALLLSVVRNISKLHQSMNEGYWSGIRGFELKNKTLAILGYGSIGKTVAHIASEGFGMKINVFDNRFIKKTDNLELITTDFESAVHNADFVSLHMSTTPETLGFINRERIEKMKDGAIFINTARGELVNEADLFKALQNRKLSAAGLDVFSREPYNPDPKIDFRKLYNVVLTPHCGSNTFEASSRMAEKVVENILAYYNNGKMTLIPEFE